MKKMLVLYIMITVLIFTGCAAEKVDKTQSAETTSQLIDIKTDNETPFEYSESNVVDMEKFGQYLFLDTLISLSIVKPYSLLRNNHGRYYTVYFTDDQRICYVFFIEEDGQLCVDFSWIYSKDMISADEFGEIMQHQLEGDVDELLIDKDKNLIYFGYLGSAVLYRSSIKEGKSVYLDMDYDGNIRVELISDNIYDIILSKDYPENLMTE